MMDRVPHRPRAHAAPVSFAIVTLCVLLGGCVPEVDKFFAEKRLNRLGIPRDDIMPGTLVIHKDGVAQSTDGILDVLPDATLSYKSFDAILPGIDRNRSLDASIALKVVDAVLPLGFDGGVKLSNSVKITQTSTAGLRITETQIRNLLASPAGAPLKAWVLDRYKRQIKTFVVLQTYKAKDFSLTAEAGKDVTADLAVNATKMVQKGEVKFKVTRTSKEQLSISGDKYYVVAVSVAAFDVQGRGSQATLGELGIDLSQPIPKRSILAGPGTAGDPAPYRAIGLAPGSDK